MTVDMAGFELALLDLDAELDSADRVVEWLHDPARTAHRLVSVPTAVLVAEALGGTTGTAPATGPVLPGGAWRVLPDRLLALHPGRRADWQHVGVTEHLEATAEVLERWGWAQTRTRHTARRTVGGRRCIVGAQTVVLRLGYGGEHTAYEAGRQIQGALTRRGVSMPYPDWNELSTTTGRMALDLVRTAAKGA